MATLLWGPGWGGHGRRPQRELAGRLDPLTLALYRWRVMSNAYDSREVLDALASRLTAAAVTTESFDGVEWTGSGG